MDLDRGEHIGKMEPMLPGERTLRNRGLLDLALGLAQRSAGFRGSLPARLIAPLANLVRSMNCYYSNFIEGHNTHPVDIERALQNEFSGDRKQRDLQLEAKAHIAVQQWIDEGGLSSKKSLSLAGIQELHRRFCELLPEDLLSVEDPLHQTRVPLQPGAFRDRDVQVGQHVAISPGAVPRFLQRFEAVYGNLGKLDTVVAAAAAHHRLLWVHPFLDGNGRVARLMSHAVLLETLDTGALWAVSRGLARNVDQYKSLLAACDEPRRGDLDGRGNLSESALADFTVFFLQVCIDQVDFMEKLMRPDELRTRIVLWAQEEIQQDRLMPNSGAVLEAILYRGELPRGDVPAVTGTGDRQARRITSMLLDRGVLSSESPKAPLRLNFPAALAGRWMPGLFPDK